MSVRELDSNHDWQFGKGLNNYKTENNAIQQNVKTRLLSWVGDCFFDLEAGVDWQNRLGLKGQQERLEQEIKQVILQTENIRDIVEVSVSLTDRELNITYEIQTIYSQTFIDNIERAL